ncbi:Reticulon-like protein B10 [Hibiscus syriacus]|uniref:Reticulon-like protein n=1 Tax=Hibiscus syriacus TaxID=106335 RepID=A0A6A2X002_HIBSY|nr:reticulon-like protein B11 [Hibiscus syriacus]KAE8667441.1 Reticulon-like protein B10 [Hibiscus syriacus]
MGDSVPTSRISVHQALGGGLAADVLLWRKWCGGVVILASATAFWCLFEFAGYSIVSFVANVLLLLVVILFSWAKSASLLNRPLPPLPNLEISERSAVKIAKELQVWVNYALSIAHDITLDRNFKLFLKIAVVLWFVSYIGSFFNFLTFVYIGIVLSLSVPMLYDKYQHHIDEKLSVTHKTMQAKYRKIDETVLRKLPSLSNKVKKMQ